MVTDCSTADKVSAHVTDRSPSASTNLTVQPRRRRRSVPPELGPIAVDTEFHKAHTLTVQAATRIDADTIAVAVLHSPAIPAPPAGFSLQDALQEGGLELPRLVKTIKWLPARPLDGQLSPLRLLHHLAPDRVPAESQILSRQEAHTYFGPPPRRGAKKTGGDVVRRSVRLTLVGHFFRADLGRLFGVGFTEGLLRGCPPDLAPVHPGTCGRRTLLIDRGRRATAGDPTIEYLWDGNAELTAAQLCCVDTMLPFGPASLDDLARTFLGLGKYDRISAKEKGNMLEVFRTRTADAYAYAAADAITTLLLAEEMARRHAGMYRSFGWSEEEAPPMRPTLGRRVSDLIFSRATANVGEGVPSLARAADRQALVEAGGSSLLTRDPRASRFGAQTGSVHGGLLFSRSPATFWHAAPGQLRDVDLSGCYAAILSRMSVYWGRPVILERGRTARTLREEVEAVAAIADRDAWLIRVSGPITGILNALIPSSPDALTTTNYDRRLRASRRQRTQRPQRAAPWLARQGGGARLYARAVESGVVTWATWAMIQALPEEARAGYENLTAESVVLYPRELVADTPEQYEQLVRRLQRDDLPWESMLDLSQGEIVTRERLTERHVALRHRIGEDVRRFIALREAAKAVNDVVVDKVWKTTANAVYGVLASEHLVTSNFVAANQVTAWARALAFALSQALNAIQTITDGATYRRDQIPACTYADCLREQPVYPLQRAEEGLAFLPAEAVPDDDADFTRWYREHVRQFFGIAGPEHDDLFGAHELVHKKCSKGGRVFDALGCHGSGSYVKCVQGQQGEWKVTDHASRGLGRKSKEVLQPWLLTAFSRDCIDALPPLSSDSILLSVSQALQKARKALREGAEAVVLPLGFDLSHPLNFHLLKLSAFVFDTPEQRTAVLKQVQRFEKWTGCGLELLALRRGYRGRAQGSLTDLANALHRVIRAGDRDFASALNVRKLSPILRELGDGRKETLAAMKAAAEKDLRQRMESAKLRPEARLTGWVLTREHLGLLDQVLATDPEA
jgi:hypothetical protein